jgi:enoyl-CoA hydratase/carnithine racemase
MTTTDKILSRKDGGVGHIVFNNPARHNAMSLDMWNGCADVLEGWATDPDIRVVVLSGAGGKAFVSGADISKFGEERASEEAVRIYNDAVERGYSAVQNFRKPTIAMIRGYCIGGGMGLASCCDLRIASSDSRFAVPAAKLGLGYGHPGVKRLLDIVGPSFTKEIFYTARQFDAAEALQMGLVNRVVPAEELEAYVADYAEKISANAPLTIDALKFTVGELLKADGDLAASDALVDACFHSRDYAEGRAAFMEKRKPKFEGR